ncbi:MAG: glycosyltransferase family 39 protein [Ginsengibacter sp.]
MNRRFVLSNKNIILLCFIIAKFVLQYLLINPVYDLQRDEYLHLDQANHLAWGYISVPPFTSWISYIIRILGNGYFWVKFFPALFGALTIVVVWKTIEALKGNLFALVLGSLAILLSVVLRINILYQPNSFDIFFWMLVYFTVIKYIDTNNSRWLLAAGAAFGFGFLSKYNIVFLALGLVPAILLSRQRKIFNEKNLYIGAAIALVIMLPNIVWQFKNDFPTLTQLQELSRTQLVNVNRSDFVKEQFIFFAGSLIIILGAFISLLFYSPFRKYRFFLWTYFITLFIFIFFKAKAYYAIGLYPVLLAFGSVYLEKILENQRRKFWKPVLIMAIVLGSVPLILIAFPFQSPAKIQEVSQRYRKLGLLRWEDGKEHNMPQDFADMLGWSELARKTDAAYAPINNKDNTLVICDNYGQAGAINYYSGYKNINAVSLNADYINWISLDKKIVNMILVREANDSDEIVEALKGFFTQCTIAGKIENEYAREMGTTIYLFTGAKTDINKIISQKINERKAAAKTP